MACAENAVFPSQLIDDGPRQRGAEQSRRPSACFNLVAEGVDVVGWWPVFATNFLGLVGVT